MPDRIKEAELRPLERNQKPSVINVPEFHPEEFDISGFVFSRRFLKTANLESLDIPKTKNDWRHLMRYAEIAKSIETNARGGPTIGRNRILITIASSPPSAGSKADYIYLRFGRYHRVKLWGVARTHFPAGHTLGWDLNGISEFLEDIPTEAWDDLFLENPSGDAILLSNIFIEHSSQTILDWDEEIWLDGSKKEPFGRIGLIAQILETKLSAIDHNWIPQLHWAAKEIGKTDWRKYGNGSVWCSEFASWCLYKALWNVPHGGSFGSNTLVNWFESQDRKYTIHDLFEGRYRLTPGDYLQVNDGGHSALFVCYLDGDPFAGPPTIEKETRIRTIEGNSCSGTVCAPVRKVGAYYIPPEPPPHRAPPYSLRAIGSTA